MVNSPGDSISGPDASRGVTRGRHLLSSPGEPMQRVIAYVDGFNLYHGIRDSKWPWAKWLNIQEMVQCFLRQEQDLVHAHYFTSRVDSPAKQRRQNTYLEALGTLSNLTIHFGRFLSDKICCARCGYTYTTHHEKMTDVNIAVQMMTDAYRDTFDVAFVVSGDSDLVGAVSTVWTLFPNKYLVAAFPPRRHSRDLASAVNGSIKIYESTFRKCLLPDPIVKPDGYRLHCPASWR